MVGVYVITLQIPDNAPTGPLRPFGLIVSDGATQYFAPSTFIPIQ
jgi:hypothetical protein